MSYCQKGAMWLSASGFNARGLWLQGLRLHGLGGADLQGFWGQCRCLESSKALNCGSCFNITILELPPRTCSSSYGRRSPHIQSFEPLILRSEIDTLMGKYVGQEHTMYLKICIAAEAVLKTNTCFRTSTRNPQSHSEVCWWFR